MPPPAPVEGEGEGDIIWRPIFLCLFSFIYIYSRYCFAISYRIALLRNTISHPSPSGLRAPGGPPPSSRREPHQGATHSCLEAGGIVAVEPSRRLLGRAGRAGRQSSRTGPLRRRGGSHIVQDVRLHTPLHPRAQRAWRARGAQG